jgi:transcriptional regulator with XRE-family HTH domain
MPKFSPDRLRALREAQHLTRDELAHRVGKTVGTITKYEQGVVTPSVHVLGDLAAVYGNNVGDLFDADDPTDPVTAFADEVRALVDRMPPLSAERRSRLRVLLRGIATARRFTPGDPRTAVGTCIRSETTA